MRPDHLWHTAELNAPLSEHGLEFFDCLEAAVYERLVAQRPDSLDRLQRGRVGLEEIEHDSLGYFALVHMPAGVVQDQDDPLISSHALLLGKSLEQEEEDLFAHRRGEPKRGGALLRADKRREIGPLVSGVDESAWSLTPRSPDGAKDRLEPNSVLIHGPELYPGSGVPALLSTYAPLEVYFDTSAAPPCPLPSRGAASGAVACNQGSACNPSREPDPACDQGAHSSTLPPSAHSTARHRAALRSRSLGVKRQPRPRPTGGPDRGCSSCHPAWPLARPRYRTRRAFAPRSPYSPRPRRCLRSASPWIVAKALENVLTQSGALPPGSAAPTLPSSDGRPAGFAQAYAPPGEKWLNLRGRRPDAKTVQSHSVSCGRTGSLPRYGASTNAETGRTAVPCSSGALMSSVAPMRRASTRRGSAGAGSWRKLTTARLRSWDTTSQRRETAGQHASRSARVYVGTLEPFAPRSPWALGSGMTGDRSTPLPSFKESSPGLGSARARHLWASPSATVSLSGSCVR